MVEIHDNYPIEVVLGFGEWIKSTSYYKSFNGKWYDWNEKGQEYTIEHIFQAYLMTLKAQLLTNSTFKI